MFITFRRPNGSLENVRKEKLHLCSFIRTRKRVGFHCPERIIGEKMKQLILGPIPEREGAYYIDLYPSRENVKKCNLDKDKIPFDDNFFDKIYGGNVIEHLTNPRNLFLESYRVLKPGGILELETDNAGFYALFSDVYYGGYEKFARSKGRSMDKHYLLFTQHSLLNFFETFGFEDNKVEYFYPPPTHPWSRNRLVLAHGLAMLNRRFVPSLRGIGRKGAAATHIGEVGIVAEKPNAKRVSRIA